MRKSDDQTTTVKRPEHPSEILASLGLGAGGKPEGERVVEHKGERFHVPENLWDPSLNGGAGGVNGSAAAKMAVDLRKQISERASQRGEAPASYSLTVPDDLSDMLEADMEHPLFAPVAEWAKTKGLDQDDFDELTNVFYTYEAARQGRGEEDQVALLQEAMGEDTERTLSDLGRWIDGLLGEVIAENSGIADTLESIAASANGVLFLNALKERIGVAGMPSGRSGDAGGAAMNRGALQALQNSRAYTDPSHPDHAETLRRVRDGFKTLYGE